MGWTYTNDANGNLTGALKKEAFTTSWSQSERWAYTWNPSNQMTKAEKFNAVDAYAGKVEYRYCLTCGGALSQRIEYSPTSATTITSWRRYEYDGLNLLRVDERYDTSGGSIDSGDPWRTLEVNTHGPGVFRNRLGKRVYIHTNNDATPDQTNDYAYAFDHIGNVYVVYHASGGSDGDEAYYFTQDAFGNELSIGSFNGDSWSTARITEHQTGKWIESFTGMYYFHARWYDGSVGRFVAREPLVRNINYTSWARGEAWRLNPYTYCSNSPLSFVDLNGDMAIAPPIAVGCGAGFLYYIMRKFGTDSFDLKGFICSTVGGCAAGGVGAIGIIMGHPIAGGLAAGAAGGVGDRACDCLLNRSPAPPDDSPWRCLGPGCMPPPGWTGNTF